MRLDEKSTNRVYVVIAVNETSRTARWNYTRDGALSGAIRSGGEVHHLKLAAYGVDPTQRVYRIPVLCPYAFGLGGLG